MSFLKSNWVMRKYRAFIVDDEYWARVNLKDKLGKFSNIEVVGEADSISGAEQGILNLQPEVLFLDIQLTEGTGFDLLNNISFTGKVIFVTAFDEYALRAFEINALDYLMKPISEESLERSLNRLQESNEVDHVWGLRLKFKNDDRLMVTVRDSIYFLEIGKISLISASLDYTELHTTSHKKFLTPRSMNEWEERLPTQNFCRIHRSHIVNLDHIEKSVKYSPNTALVYLEGFEQPVKVSRTYFKKLKEKYM